MKNKSEGNEGKQSLVARAFHIIVILVFSAVTIVFIKITKTPTLATFHFLNEVSNVLKFGYNSTQNMAIWILQGVGWTLLTTFLFIMDLALAIISLVLILAFIANLLDHGID